MSEIKQSVVFWCFQKILGVETLIQEAAAMGLHSVELTPPKYWPLLKRHGLTCAIVSSHGFLRGWNHQENHPECLEKVTQAIENAAAAGFPNVITLSGMKNSVSDEQGMANTIEGLRKILPLAEKKGVNLCLEPLNTRVDEEMKGHPGYQCDSLEWAVEVCQKIGSPRLKILYDIYHQQIMQGDLVRRIQQYHEYIGHYHTAGNPGRGPLDDPLQEIHYPSVMRAILQTGYDGYVGHEFFPPEDDAVASLRRAVEMCGRFA